jgi:ribosome-associated protein
MPRSRRAVRGIYCISRIDEWQFEVAFTRYLADLGVMDEVKDAGTTEKLVGIELAIGAARVVEEMQAGDVQVLDVRGLSSITDFFVLCTGSSLPHLRAVRRELQSRLLEEHRVKPFGSDGEVGSLWLVVDFVDVIVHIFHEEKREMYRLEDLWSDAPLVDWQA